MSIGKGGGERIEWRAYLFVLPNFLGFALFVGLPVLASLALAFHDWDILTPPRWAGLANFQQLLGDGAFWKYLWNTLFLMSAIPISMALALALALLLNQALPARAVFRTILFLPSIASGIALYIAWKQFFHKDFGFLGRMLPAGVPIPLILWLEGLALCLGVALLAFLAARLWLDWRAPGRDLAAGRFLAAGVVGWCVLSLVLGALLWLHPGLAAWRAQLGGTAGASGWLNDPWLAKPAIMLLILWTTMGGYSMVLYLAALQNIDPALYEAAAIDGASPWQRFRYITWPLLTPTTFFIFVTSLIAGFQGGFEYGYIMTEGGPYSPGLPWTPWAGENLGETTTLSYYIYTNAYEDLKMGYASAVAWVLFLLVLGVTLLVWKYGGKKVEY